MLKVGLFDKESVSVVYVEVVLKFLSKEEFMGMLFFVWMVLVCYFVIGLDNLCKVKEEN